MKPERATSLPSSQVWLSSPVCSPSALLGAAPSPAAAVQQQCSSRAVPCSSSSAAVQQQQQQQQCSAAPAVQEGSSSSSAAAEQCSRSAASRVHKSSGSLTQTELDCDSNWDSNWYTRQSTAVAGEPNTPAGLLPPLLLGRKPLSRELGQRAEEHDFLGYTKLDHHRAFGSSFCHCLGCPGTGL